MLIWRACRDAFSLTVLLCAVAAAMADATAQTPARLSIDAIYDPAARVDFSGAPPTDLTWFDATRTSKRAAAIVAWTGLKVDASSRVRPRRSSRPTPWPRRWPALPGVGANDARTAASAPVADLQPARTGALVTIADDLYFYEFSAGRAVRLTSTTEKPRTKRRSAPTAVRSRSCAATTCTPWTSRRSASRH